MSGILAGLAPAATGCPLSASGRILLVDDAGIALDAAAGALAEAGFELEAVRGADAACEALAARAIDLVVAGLGASRSGGLVLLRRIRSGEAPRPGLPVVLVAARGELPDAMEAGRLGASAFVSLADEGVEGLLARARAHVAGVRPPPPDELVGPSAGASALRGRIAALAELAVPVLVRGPPDCGHDAVASQLHALGPRAARTLARHPGGSPPPKLPLAGPGTLHVAGLERLTPAEQQALRTELRRAGPAADAERVRLVVSSGADPRSAVEAGQVDAELLERLERFALRLPPLRERRLDLPALLERFLRRAAARLGRPVAHVEPQVADALARHPWPGNLRELERLAELLVAFAPGGSVTADTARAALAGLESPLDRIARDRERAEREQLLELYRRHGTYTGVARELGLTRNAAKYRFARHGLIPERGPGRR